MSKTLFFVLIIYLFFSFDSYSQNLKLILEGENDKETKIIDSLSYKKTHSDYKQLKLEVDSLQQKLFKTGFIETEVTSINRKDDSTFLAKLHLKNKIYTIYIYYNKNEINPDILNLVSNTVNSDYFILPIDQTEVALNFINNKLADEGSPFSKLKLANIRSEKQNELIADLVISKNTNKRTVDKIIIKGYEKFPKSFIKHYLKIKTSEPFNLSKIKARTNLLNDLQFASNLKEPEILFTKDSTALYLYLEKSRSNNFDGFLGFGTNETTNKIEFTGYLNLQLHNNLNYGESLRLQYKSDQSEQKTFNVELILPYLIGSPLGTELQLNIFKKDSSFTTVNQIAKLIYQLSTKSKVSLGINAIQSNNLLSEATSINSIKDYKTTFYNLRYSYTRRQSYNRLFPVNFMLDIETGIGKRKLESVSEQQLQAQINSYKIFSLNLKNSIYLRINSFGLFSDTYLDNELNRLGGINSIRGFEENSLFASFHSLINTEYRYQLNNAIYIHSIIDAAYLENKIINQKEKLYGFGFGFGILTKAGLLKFNYANGKLENQKFKFSNSQIHLSLTALF